MAGWLGGPRRDLGHDPDYRFTLANERTFLAWIRTALALNAGGLAIVQLLRAVTPGTRRWLGLVLVVLGTSLALLAYRRWIGVEEALRDDRPLPGTRLPLLLSLGVAVVSLVAIALVITGTGA